MKDTIEKIIISTLIELNEELDNKELENPTKSTRLYGARGTLDSLALVALITDLEESISEQFDVSIVLADEKAMSQKTSPFRSVESLSSYIEKLLET